MTILQERDNEIGFADKVIAKMKVANAENIMSVLKAELFKVIKK